jgi:hypothetical protein
MTFRRRKIIRLIQCSREYLGNIREELDISWGKEKIIISKVIIQILRIFSFAALSS